MMSYNDKLKKFENSNIFSQSSIRLVVLYGEQFSGRTTFANLLQKYSIFKKIDIDDLDKILELSKTGLYPLVFPYTNSISDVIFFKNNNAFTIKLEASEEIREKRGKLNKKQSLNENENADIWNCIFQNDGSLDDLTEFAIFLSKML